MEKCYDMRLYLKVKIKSLAAEAKIIRKEEKRNPNFRKGLEGHRKGIVRSAARHTLLAYGFLRGRSYESLEAKCHIEPDWKRVWTMIEKYGICIPEDYSHTKEHGFRSEYQKKLSEDEKKRFAEWIPVKKSKVPRVIRKILSKDLTNAWE